MVAACAMVTPFVYTDNTCCDRKKNPRIKYTALAIATVQGHGEIVKFLLESGADVNIATSDGRSLQSVARSVNLPEEVTNLIHARVNTRKRRARPRV